VLEPNGILIKVINRLSYHIENYQDCVQSETADGHVLGKEYVFGLLRTEAGKRNMERINEELTLSGNGYERVQQFITDSLWSASRLVSEIALNTSRLYAEQWKGQGQDIGYIIDDSARIKKGKKSVGAARQYAGVLGKVENCQVGVYVSLVCNTHRSLINERLFLPASWTSDPKRCDKAGIPEEHRTFKTKLELALDMVKADREAGIAFDWVGGDGLYGHGLEFGNALDVMELTFLLDVHCNQFIYPVKPHLGVPECTSTRRREANLAARRCRSYSRRFLRQTAPASGIADRGCPRWQEWSAHALRAQISGLGLERGFGRPDGAHIGHYPQSSGQQDQIFPEQRRLS
jgi:SRSO17 transposase